VKIEVDGTACKTTKAAKRSAAPEWNEPFYYDGLLPGSIIRFQVMQFSALPCLHSLMSRTDIEVYDIFERSESGGGAN